MTKLVLLQRDVLQNELTLNQTFAMCKVLITSFTHTHKHQLSITIFT